MTTIIELTETEKELTKAAANLEKLNRACEGWINDGLKASNILRGYEDNRAFSETKKYGFNDLVKSVEASKDKALALVYFREECFRSAKHYNRAAALFINCCNLFHFDKFERAQMDSKNLDILKELNNHYGPEETYLNNVRYETNAWMRYMKKTEDAVTKQVEEKARFYDINVPQSLKQKIEDQRDEFKAQPQDAASAVK